MNERLGPGAYDANYFYTKPAKTAYTIKKETVKQKLNDENSDEQQ